MREAAVMYGRLGPDYSGGDPHVADLLKRTYTKLREVDEGRQVLSGPVYTMPLPQMTTLYNQWIASLLWQVALVFTDGVIQLHYNEPELPQEIYNAADTLCDDAARATRQTTLVQARYAETGRAPLSQQRYLPQLPNNKMTYLGVWNACNEIINQVSEDLDMLTKLGVPARMAGIHAALTKVITTHATAAKALRADWQSTTMADNRTELTQELLTHTAAIFEAGQQLWAPYLVGQKFKEAIQKQKGPDELDLGFDPWILTDPRRKDVTKLTELIGFWESVTNRDAVPALAGEVEAARRSGAIRWRTNRGYTTIPWQSQFLVVRPVKLGGSVFEPGQLCAYYPARKGAEVTVEVRRAGAVRGILELLGATTACQQGAV